jgi:hypothetical protein
MSDLAASGADSAPLVIGPDSPPIDFTWLFQHGVVLNDPSDAGLLAMSDDGLPIDVPVPAFELVQVDRSHEEPFFNDDDIGDWSGTAHDARRLMMTPGGQAYDFVVGGDLAESDHMLSGHPTIAGWGEAAPVVAMAHDLLVDLGHLALGGGSSGLAPFGGATATHTDSGVWGGAIVADLQAPELSWLAGVDAPGGHVGEAWAWDAGKGAYVFHHFV